MEKTHFADFVEDDPEDAEGSAVVTWNITEIDEGGGSDWAVPTIFCFEKVDYTLNMARVQEEGGAVIYHFFVQVNYLVKSTPTSLIQKNKQKLLTQSSGIWELLNSS